MEISVELIKNLSLFRNLSDDEIASSLHIFKSVAPEEPNYVLFNEGEEGDSLYLILEGEVEIRKIIDANSGDYKLLTILQEGSFFGEMALLTGETRSATAVLKNKNGKLLKVEREAFMNFMSSSPRVASLILGVLVKWISDRLRASSDELVTLYEMGRIIGRNTDFNDLVHNVLDRTIKANKATAGFVMIWNEIVECFECKIALPEFPPLTVIGKDTNLVKYWLKLDDPVSSSFTDDFVSTDELHFSMPSVMYAPLITQSEDSQNNYRITKRVTGVVVLVSDKPNAFAMSQINLTRGVTNQVSQAIANSSLLMENEARRNHNLVYVTADL